MIPRSPVFFLVVALTAIVAVAVAKRIPVVKNLL
jgi:hypothetical protein